jgi:predicted esterase
MRTTLFAVLTCLTIALPLSAELTVQKGELVEGLACSADATQTYTLYLPSSFSNDREWPVLLVYDPRGRATMAAEIFRPAAEEHGWILISSNDTRSDGPPDPNVKALNALIPELTRYPVDQARIYMTGFSGGAILAFLVAARSDGAVAGVIGCGGRFPDGWERKPVKFAHWGTAGSTDFNYSQMRAIDEFLEKTGAVHRFEPFEGAHQWMPSELATHAVEWMELDAMRRRLRKRDDAMIERLWSEYLEGVVALQQEGDPAEVLRRWKAIEGTFRELREVSDATARIEELESDKAVKGDQQARCRWRLRGAGGTTGSFVDVQPALVLSSSRVHVGAAVRPRRARARGGRVDAPGLPRGALQPRLRLVPGRSEREGDRFPVTRHRCRFLESRAHGDRRGSRGDS